MALRDLHVRSAHAFSNAAEATFVSKFVLIRSIPQGYNNYCSARKKCLDPVLLGHAQDPAQTEPTPLDSSTKCASADVVSRSPWHAQIEQQLRNASS